MAESFFDFFVFGSPGSDDSVNLVKNCGKSASELYPEVFGSKITWSSGCGLFEGTRTLDERPELPSPLCGVLLIIYAIAGAKSWCF